MGKIITYASGLNASVIVWIVEKAREEHASAIEWLNENTNEDIDFFLIELHAYQIGDSKPAPLFKIIEQPNDFVKTTKVAVKDTSSGRYALRLEFWNQFNEIIEERHKPFNIRKATTNHWYNVSLGSSKCRISIDLVNRENRIRIGLWIPDDKDLFNYLLSKRQEIESACNLTLDWVNDENQKCSTICTSITGLDFDNQSNYKELMNKTIDLVLIIRKTFQKYL